MLSVSSHLSGFICDLYKSMILIFAICTLKEWNDYHSVMPAKRVAFLSF